MRLGAAALALAAVTLAALALASAAGAAETPLRHGCDAGPFDGDAGRRGDASDQRIIVAQDVPTSGVVALRSPPDHLARPGCYDGGLSDAVDADRYELEAADNATVRVLGACMDIVVDHPSGLNSWKLNRCEGDVLEIETQAGALGRPGALELGFFDGPGTYRFHWSSEAGVAAP